MCRESGVVRLIVNGLSEILLGIEGSRVLHNMGKFGGGFSVTLLDLVRRMASAIKDNSGVGHRLLRIKGARFGIVIGLVVLSIGVVGFRVVLVVCSEGLVVGNMSSARGRIIMLGIIARVVSIVGLIINSSIAGLVMVIILLGVIGLRKNV